MLIRMLARAFRRSPTRVSPVFALAPSSAAVGAAQTRETDVVVARVRALSKAGQCAEAAILFDEQVRTPDDPQEAQRLLEQAALPVFEACARVGDVATACAFEERTYRRLIRAFEEPAHYEACFSRVDAPLFQLGRAQRDAGACAMPAVEAVGPRRLLFFVHTLGYESLAHVQLLADLIEAHVEATPEDGVNIGLVGVASGGPGPRVQRLRDRWNVRVWCLPPQLPLHEMYGQAANLVYSEGFGRLVFNSVPVGLSYASGLLGERLAWLSMKFELSCFEHLVHRCSFTSGLRQAREVAGRRWLAAPPLFRERAELQGSGQPPAVLQQARRFGTVFYTVNREEKIRNPEFLEAVAAILRALPDSSFVWTGKQRHPGIEAFFESRGLGQRQFFAGWVSPDDLLLGADIFLDTPVLSGAVAARAVACGCPVVTWTDARSWVNFFMPAYRRDRRQGAALPFAAALDRLQDVGLPLECEDRSQYAAHAVRLAKSRALRREYGEALKGFALHYFFDRSRSAAGHIANLRGEPLTDQGEPGR